MTVFLLPVATGVAVAAIAARSDERKYCEFYLLLLLLF